ncbi:hypothetical protein RPMA_06315 [Tardiphaga alba]|uniref:HEAT repeat domain-containing protein n=1 Tax=Tardiphaga alba TaxID=340268 RepID=A0ABX8A4E5_9BRAD|nr:hypothetical protein [Tardiphaga alba]QUS38488.1 hypothetical protein RPMA_06315 [Tardiphaga alba]
MSAKFKVFLAILIGFCLLTSLFPAVYLFLLLFSLGLAYPLIYANTLLLFVLAALPALQCYSRNPGNKRRIVIAALLVPLIGIVLPQAVRVITTYNMQGLRAGDVERVLPSPPRQVELFGEPSVAIGNNTPVHRAPCDELCQSLLLSSQVDLVRVTRERAIGAPRPERLDYVLEQQSSCPSTFVDGQPVLQQSKDAISTGTCFVARQAGDEQLPLRIARRIQTFDEPKNPAQDLTTIFTGVKRVTVMEVSTVAPSGWSLATRNTEVTFSYWATPLFVMLAPCHGMCVGAPVFRRVEHTLNAFDPVAYAFRVIGLKQPAPPAALGPAERVNAVLDRGDAALTDNQNELVREWAMHAMRAPCQFRRNGCPPLDAADRATLVRLLKDRRVQEFSFITNVLDRNRDVAADQLDMLLDEMAARGANSIYTVAIGAVVARLDSDLLRARSDRFLPLIRDNDWNKSRSLAMAAGRLGVDTSDLITERLKQPASAKSAGEAACMADEAIGRALVPALLEYLRSRPVSMDYPQDASQVVVTALARYGHYQEAKEIYLTRFPRMRTSLPGEKGAGGREGLDACL